MPTYKWRTFPQEQYTSAMESMIAARTSMGREKWGEDFHGDPLTHAEEEAMDLCYYLYVLRRQRASLKAQIRGKTGDVVTLGFNEFAQECHETAQKNGWHDLPRTFGDELALIHSEVSEALEAYRDTGDARSPEVVEELADIIIRVADVVCQHNVDIEQAIAEKMEKNSNRPYRHGGKHL